MKVVSVVGSRAQFVKLAPVARALADAREDHVVVHTGPAFQQAMYADLFDRFRLPGVDTHLGLPPATATRETAEVIAALEPVLTEHAPDWVLAYGDTDTTLATVLAAAKSTLASAHVEAGLRSYDRTMPRERNRIAADHTADLLLAPTAGAVERLAAEGLADRTRLVGDVMVDVLNAAVASIAQQSAPDSPRPRRGRYVVVTLQRSANIDDPGRLGYIIAALGALPERVLLVANPALFRAAQRHRISLEAGRIRRVPPLTYVQMIDVLSGASGVVTDSSGLQKEAYVLGIPCTTLRTETEWPETLHGGWNILTPDVSSLAELALRPAPTAERGAPFGDGTAARTIVEALRQA